MAIKNDQIVSFLYEVKDVSTKKIVDSNMNGSPLTFMIGRNQIISGLENALKSMDMGDSGDILVKSIDAYGEYNQDAVQILPVEQFAGIPLENGMTLYGQDEEGGTVAVVVKSFDNHSVTIDFNHHLAGKDLLFSTHVVMVRNATDDELLTGTPYENLNYGGSCSSGGGSCGCGTGYGDDDNLFGGGCATDGGHSHGGGSCGTGHCH